MLLKTQGKFHHADSVLAVEGKEWGGRIIDIFAVVPAAGLLPPVIFGFFDSLPILFSFPNCAPRLGDLTEGYRALGLYFKKPLSYSGAFIF